MTSNLGLKGGHDIAYHTDRPEGGHVGGMAYYTGAMGEPPGVWAGKGAAKLGLTGNVDAGVIKRLFHEDIGPDGERITARRKALYDNADADVVASAVKAYKADHPNASEIELSLVRSATLAGNRQARAYFDFALGAVKSVSLLHASLIVSAKLARDEGDDEAAGKLDSEAADIQDALFQTAQTVVREIETSAAYTRTGAHHGRDQLGNGSTGEWRDAAGVTAPIFVQHTSHEGDPHLHAHVTVWNRVQRADDADPKYRTLDSRSLHAERLRLAGLADKDLETRMTRLGWPMEIRPDGNGAEVAGVSREVIEQFSTRTVRITPKIAELVEEYKASHGGKMPNARTMWAIKQYVSMDQRAKSPKGEDWERRVTEEEVRVLAGVHRSVRAATGSPRPVLDDRAKAKAARIAVAEVQKHRATWSMSDLMFEVHRALPVLTADADSRSLITEIAKLAVSGRADTQVVQVTAGDITDVSSLGVRESDGGSIYRPPNEARWTTLEHLDTEQRILENAKQTRRQLVTEDEARKAVAATDLSPEQADAVVLMLTSTSATTALVAPAGSGKSHTMAVFAKLWTQFTGRRVIGLTTSTSASRVLANEGLAESYNIAQFLGKTVGSDELRRPVPLHADDRLVLDEATQVSTTDWAMVQEAAQQAGARVDAVGDTQQLGAPEAGGMFRLLAQEVPAAELHEIRRFDAQWEAEASVQLRAADFTAIAAYDRRGRIWGGDKEAAYDRAASLWLADHQAGKDALLLAGSNAEAAELARRVQDRLIRAGAVQNPCIPLADQNSAGVGDLIRARLNTHIDAGGQRLSNRDTLRVTADRGPDAEVRRRRLNGTWTAPFRVPKAYLASDAELDYSGNTHVGEGRTVDAGYLLVTESLTRAGNYVGMTRGRESNTAIVVTGETAPEGHEPFEQLTPESVIKSVMQRENEDLSATEHIRISQEYSGSTGHVLNLWAATTRETLYPKIDELIKAGLTEREGWRYEREHSRPVLQNKLRETQLAGHDINRVIEQITADPMDGARSISSVLHGRLDRLDLPGPDHVTWAQRTPEDAPQLAHELAAGLDDRSRALGERVAERPEPWLIRQLGVLPADASPVLHEDYARRAGSAAAYREAAGITDPEQAISAEPHKNSPELETLRQQVITDLEIPDDAALLRAAARGDLEARQLAGERAMTTAPPDVSAHLRLTAQAEQDARLQAAAAQAQQDYQVGRSAEALAETLAAEKTKLELANTAYEGWSGRTREVRETGGQAKAELARRGLDPEVKAEPEQSLTGWWREFEADADGLDRAIEREHEAAVQAGGTWPPERAKASEVQAEVQEGPHPEAAEVLAGLRRDGYLPEVEHQAETDVEVSEPEAPDSGEIPQFEAGSQAEEPEPTEHEHQAEEAQIEPDDQASRLDTLRSQISQATEAVAAEEAHHEAGAEYVARVEREAQAEPEVQAETEAIS